jgi:serine/threonine protein kinase
MFQYREDSAYGPVAYAEPMPASLPTPAPHPTLSSLPRAVSTPPVHHGHGRPPPVRLTAEGVAMTAFQWQRPPIGKGGFSSVYEGLFYGATVAVKVLTIRNESERLMFEEELRAMLNPRLFHHNICPLLGYCYEHPAFIFPKLSPLSLDRLRRLPADVRDSVCIDVARGLAHMHAAGYVHSDMKPDNVLIEFDQNRVIRRALVGDLGCVKSCAVPVVPFGTIVFLDPALPQGVPRLPHPADDVYSLGVTFLCIFMEAIPMNMDDIRRMESDLAQRDPMRFSLVRDMMNQVPSRRPTCADVANIMRRNQEELWSLARRQSSQRLTTMRSGPVASCVASEQSLVVPPETTNVSPSCTPSNPGHPHAQPSHQQPARRNSAYSSSLATMV